VKIEDADVWTMSSDALAEFRLHKIVLYFRTTICFPDSRRRKCRYPLILQKRNWDEALVEAERNLEIVGLKTAHSCRP